MEHIQYLEKKKKKKRRKKWWLLFFVLAAAGAGMFFYQKQISQAEQADPNARENVTLSEGQSWRFLQIENIIGNEIQAVEEEKGAEKGETETYQIPVGTEVVTKLGSVTTFSRLASGDKIACLIEEADGESVILKIWIEE